MSDSDLPSNVVKLDCPNGSKVYLVGTVHFSPGSVQDVRQTIILKRPKVVVMELCNDRRGLLHCSDEDILREAKTMTLAKMKIFIRRFGLLAGIAQSLYFKVSAEMTQELGVAPGGEFRAGYEEANKIKADIHLGDRLVGITFNRALATFSFWNKLYVATLLLRMLTRTTAITAEEVENLRSRSMVQLLLGDFTSQYPNLTEVVVNERDRILAHSLMVSANCAHQPYGPPVTIVGVIGIAHIDGVCSNWMSVGDICPLLVNPKPSRVNALVWTGIKFSFRQGIFSVCVLSSYFIGRRLYTFLVC